MSESILSLSPHDSIIARDGRPFGEGQGHRMRGLPWLPPSVVAGSLRTALVKSNDQLDFSNDMPTRLMAIEVAGAFPVHKGELYMPAPTDCLREDNTSKVHRVTPVEMIVNDGADFPEGGLRPVCLSKEQAQDDFKGASVPAWWPISKIEEWLTSTKTSYDTNWFTPQFLESARQESRDHVCLKPESGAAEEGLIFSTVGLNVSHLPRFFPNVSRRGESQKPFADRYAEITLSVRVKVPESESSFSSLNNLKLWHPLGGERRMVHWSNEKGLPGWNCQPSVKTHLGSSKRIRMILATPAIFSDGWKPGWLNEQLEGTPPRTQLKLKLVGVSNGRWKAVSGWSLAKPRGPKAIRRMVPSGSVYFFNIIGDGSGDALSECWLQSVCDDEQAQRDGFGLALWGTY